MPNDINKKKSIEAALDTETFTQGINSINTVIDALLAKQQQLNVSGQQNAATFNAIAVQLESFQKKLVDLNTQLTSNATAFNSLNTSVKSLDGTLSSVGSTAVNTGTKLSSLSGNISKATTDSNKLQEAISSTNKTLTESGKNTDQSKSKFDAHKLTMDHLKKSFDEVKDVSGIFGPSLKDAAKGFDLMKSGLTVVKDGLTGVGTALKADGFDFLLQILQSIFEYFIKTSNGSKMLQGAISAIGVVVNKVTGIFHSFMDGIINAVSHPIDTLKSLGKMIEQNLINRFTAFGTILDGIIHLDFKKVANGVIQAGTGITNATDKIEKTFNTVKKAVVTTAAEMGKAYTKGYAEADKAVDKHEKKVLASNKKIRNSNNKTVKISETKDNTVNESRGSILEDPVHAGVEIPGSSAVNQPVVADIMLTQQTETKKAEIKKTALQQFEDYAKKNRVKMANDAINTLSNTIKQQSDAKIAGLEKDKANELSNKNLTAIQKAAIEQKYKQQENAIKAKAFKEQQELSIAQAIINGAEAVTKASAQTGVFAPLAIGVVIAETAAQIAKIASQKPPAYAKGGLHYNSDGRGGVLSGYSRTDNTNAYLRSGEGIVVSEAMRVPWARNLVSAINVGFGGRDFSMVNPSRGYAVGGIFTDGGDANRYYNQPVNDQKNLANTIAYQMINNFPPVYVDVKDINNQQNILAQTINRVNL